MKHDLSDTAFDTLRRAVNMARELEVSSLKTLRARLLAEGAQEADVDEALRYWARYSRNSAV